MIISVKPIGSENDFPNTEVPEVGEAMVNEIEKNKESKQRTRREVVYGFVATFASCFRRAIGQEK